MKNEEPNFDEGWFENDWWDEEPEEKKDRIDRFSIYVQMIGFRKWKRR